jgi:2',3'-cyclic-nucleotide 2'-phosphodiesterase/3'-nucleotidase
MMINAMRIKVDGDRSVLKDYEDADKISDEYREEIATAIEMGLIYGRDINEFDPQAEMIMGGLASMLHNYQAKYKQLDLLSTNDFHGKLKAGYEAGAAKLAAMIKHYRSANSEGTMLLDGGDAYQGTPVSGLNQGKPVIEVYNHLGYTAQAVGNHEFDWGIETIKKIDEQTDFPFLAANIYNKDTGQHVDWAKKYIMKDLNGIKVGIIGVSTPDTKSTTMPSNVAALEFKNPANVIRELAPQLREKGADMVIVVSHLPGTMDFDTGELAGELVRTAKEVNVDGIIGGHSHHTVTGIVNGVPVVEAYKHGRELGNLRYYVNKDTDKIYQAKPMSHPVRSSKMEIQADETVQAIVDKYQKELEPIMSEVLTNSKVELKRNYDKISNIGSLITEVMKEDADVDVALQNPGGIRIDLPAGKITVGDWYEVLPFGNTIVTAEMTGAQIIKVLEQSLTLQKGMMQMAGLKVKYNSSKPEYKRVEEVTMADGTKLQKDKTYTVATNNFLAEGGDNYSTFKEVNFTNTYKKVRSAVIEYLRTQDTISPKADDRVIGLNKQAAAYSFNPAA